MLSNVFQIISSRTSSYFLRDSFSHEEEALISKSCTYEMACGHSRRPRKKNLEHNFAGFAPIEHSRELEDRTLASRAVLRSESRAPKTRKCTLEAPLESQSDPQILFRGLRGVPKTSLGGPRENFGTPSPLGGRVRTCGLQRNAHSLGTLRKRSGDATSRFCPPAPRAQNS